MNFIIKRIKNLEKKSFFFSSNIYSSSSYINKNILLFIDPKICFFYVLIYI